MSFPRQVVQGRSYLVTRRCTQRQFLLRPDDATNDAFVYCLAYAAQRSEISVVAFIANSNHYHAVVVDVKGRIPQFLEEFHKLLAKHQNVLRGRWENFWSSEQTSLVELVGAEDILAKVVYTLSNPVKDHLVERVHHWPGASSLLATASGAQISVRRPYRFFRREGRMPERLTLRCVRAPGFETMGEAEYRDLINENLGTVEAAAAAERKVTGRRVLGRSAILRQRPTDRPDSKEPRRRLDPRVAARDKGPRIEAILRLKSFRTAHAAASEIWLAGKYAVFPEGTWSLRRFSTVARAPCLFAS